MKEDIKSKNPLKMLPHSLPKVDEFSGCMKKNNQERRYL